MKSRHVLPVRGPRRRRAVRRGFEAIARERAADPQALMDTYLTDDARVSCAEPLRVLDGRIARSRRRRDAAMGAGFMAGQFDRLREVLRRFPAGWLDGRIKRGGS